LLTCRLNGVNAYYKDSTKTQIKHKNCANTNTKALNKQNKNNPAGKSDKKRTRAKGLNTEKTRQVDIKMSIIIINTQTSLCYQCVS
jgi:hypothetical protein